jgi:hypothetical protein
MPWFTITTQFTTIQILLSHTSTHLHDKQRKNPVSCNITSWVFSSATGELQISHSKWVFLKNVLAQLLIKSPPVFDNGIHKTPPMTRNLNTFPPIYTFTFTPNSRNSVIGIAATLRGWTVWGSDPGKGEFSLLKNVQPGSGACPPCYSMGTGVLSRRIKRPRRDVYKFTIHFHVVSRLRSNGTIPQPPAPPPPHI